jgi:4-carboxymuconolactone decarboxylase
MNARAGLTVADVAPKFAEISKNTLIGDVWERPGLSKRDRSLITVASHLARAKTQYLPEHMRKAMANGVTPEELGELITHLAFYASWPNASAAADVLVSVLNQTDQQQ